MERQAPEPTTDMTQSSDPSTAREAAALLGVNERTVRRAIARGELVAGDRRVVEPHAVG